MDLEPKYINVLEYGQKHNRLHIHLVISGGISREELAKLWGLGAVSAEPLRFEKDGLVALARYLTKGGETADRPTWKRWSGSRNLEKLTVTERDGRLSHRKMADLCHNGGDADYLETQFDGYEMADFSLEVSEDIYGGLYLSATLKKLPTRTDAWSGVGWLPVSLSGDNVVMNVELITPVAIGKGLRFAIREGGRTVGSGVVTEIYE